MSFTTAVLILAQSAAPQAADAPTQSRASSGVSVQMQASATVIRPARVTFDREGASALRVSGAQAAQVQRSRDSNGTLWADFS